MLFNSFAYLVFLPLALVLAFAAPRGWRWAVLLGLSVVFYGWWNPLYLVPLAVSAGVDYVAARAMARRESRAARRPWLVASVVANLGLLAIFKYADFALTTAAWLSNGAWAAPALGLVLPVGISFYTFQSLAYTIDVYRGRESAEPNAGRFFLYVLFFPQLVAGPIERSTALMPQLRAEPRWDAGRAASGLLLILWGLVKKVVVADRLALFVDAVYGNPQGYGPAALWLATYAFAFQIYGDFSGYSDIAIGSARLLGVDLMRNFRTPYASTSVTEFWRRWHISLSTWFRDYLYVPLGGNRRGETRTRINLLVVFLVSGLWHGAAWTFVVWGALHGLYVLAERVTGTARDRLWSRSGAAVQRWRRPLALVVTFHAVVLAWVFFRADGFGDATTILGRMLDIRTALHVGLPREFGPVRVVLSAALVGTMLWVEHRAGDAGVETWAGATAVRQRVFVVACLVALGLLGLWRETAFIYFQF